VNQERTTKNGAQRAGRARERTRKESRVAAGKNEGRDVLTHRETVNLGPFKPFSSSLRGVGSEKAKERCILR